MESGTSSLKRKCREFGNDGKEEDETQAPGISPAATIAVGYILTSKKIQSFLQPKLIRLARSKGIEFIPIDVKRPLSEQGPFNIILHKSAGDEWSQVLEAYQMAYPEATVLDPPAAIKRLSNRQTMLETVADLNLPDSLGKVCVPRQLVLSNSYSSVPDEVAEAGLSLPLVVKPLVVDGSAKSHKLFLASDQLSLSELEAPVVLQEFVNHGGVLFKVFVVGESYKVVRRSSLPDVSKGNLSKSSGLLEFPRVSSAAASDNADFDPSIEPPPHYLLEVLARELCHGLGLRLFNFDLIRQRETKDLYYIIDINYFPGFGKMPEYEHVFTDFLLSLVQSK